MLRQSVTILSGPPTPLLPFRLQHLVFEAPDQIATDADSTWTDGLLFVVGALLDCVEDSLVFTINQSPHNPFPIHTQPSPLKSLDIISYDTFDCNPALLPFLRRCHALETLRLGPVDSPLFQALPNPLRMLNIDDVDWQVAEIVVRLRDQGCVSLSAPHLVLRADDEARAFYPSGTAARGVIERGGITVGSSLPSKRLGALAFIDDR